MYSFISSFQTKLWNPCSILVPCRCKPQKSIPVCPSSKSPQMGGVSETNTPPTCEMCHCRDRPRDCERTGEPVRSPLKRQFLTEPPGMTSTYLTEEEQGGRKAPRQRERPGKRLWYMKAHGTLCPSITMEHSYKGDHIIYTTPKGPSVQGTITSLCLSTPWPSWDPKIRKVSLDLPVPSREDFIHLIIYSFICSFICLSTK